MSGSEDYIAQYVVGIKRQGTLTRRRCLRRFTWGLLEEQPRLLWSCSWDAQQGPGQLGVSDVWTNKRIRTHCETGTRSSSQIQMTVLIS